MTQLSFSPLTRLQVGLREMNVFLPLMTCQGEEPDLPGTRFIFFLSAVQTIAAPLTLKCTFAFRGYCYMVEHRRLCFKELFRILGSNWRTGDDLNIVLYYHYKICTKRE